MPQAFTEQLKEVISVQGSIPSSNHTNNTDTSIAAVDMSRFYRLMTLISSGVLDTANSTNVQVYFRASATSNMASPTNVANAIPYTGNTNSAVDSLEVRTDQLPAGTRYCQAVVIVNSATANIAVIQLASGGGRYEPASQPDQGVTQRLAT